MAKIFTCVNSHSNANGLTATAVNPAPGRSTRIYALRQQNRGSNQRRLVQCSQRAAASSSPCLTLCWRAKSVSPQARRHIQSEGDSKSQCEAPSISSSRHSAEMTLPQGAATDSALQRDGGARISSASVRSRPAAAKPSRSVSPGIARSNGSSPTKPTTPGVSAASRLDSPPAEKPTSMILFIGAPKVPPARSEPTSAEMARALQRKSKVQGRSGVIASTPASASATAWPASVRRLRVKPCEKIAAPRGVLAAG